MRKLGMSQPPKLVPIVRWAVGRQEMFTSLGPVLQLLEHVCLVVFFTGQAQAWSYWLSPVKVDHSLQSSIEKKKKNIQEVNKCLLLKPLSRFFGSCFFLFTPTQYFSNRDCCTYGICTAALQESSVFCKLETSKQANSCVWLLFCIFIHFFAFIICTTSLLELLDIHFKSSKYHKVAETSCLFHLDITSACPLQKGWNIYYD